MENLVGGLEMENLVGGLEDGTARGGKEGTGPTDYGRWGYGDLGSGYIQFYWYNGRWGSRR